MTWLARLSGILNDMGLRYDYNIALPSFSVNRLDAKILVEHVLIIDDRNDIHLKESIEAQGYAYLELRLEELENDDWREPIKNWIAAMVEYGKRRRKLYQNYMISLPDPPEVEVPGIGIKRIDRRWI